MRLQSNDLPACHYFIICALTILLLSYKIICILDVLFFESNRMYVRKQLALFGISAIIKTSLMGRQPHTGRSQGGLRRRKGFRGCRPRRSAARLGAMRSLLSSPAIVWSGQTEVWRGTQAGLIKRLLFSNWRGHSRKSILSRNTEQRHKADIDMGVKMR